jgi:hypothetical protein
VVARVVALLTIAACSGNPRPEEAASGVASRSDAGPAGDAGPSGDAGPAGDASPPRDAPGARLAIGDLQIRVQWPDVPVVARSSPGRTPCNTPRTPSVAPTTTWGVPDALVIVDGAAPPLAAAHLTLADCTLTPRVAVGGSLAITSAVDRPAKLVLRKRASLATLGQLAAGEPIPVMLPIAGHTVTTALEPGAIYSLETDATDPEVAFVAAIANGHVTDASGQAMARGLAAGPHAVTAWLPPRAGQPARTGHGTATVAAGDLAELTVTLAP